MAPYDTNIPGAAGYAQAALLAKTAYQQALARLNAQRQGTLRQYGYQADVDPATGVPRNLRVDPNNPYGEYQGIRRGHADMSEQLEDELAGAGLRGGLARQQESRQRLDFGRDDAQLGTALTGSLAGLQDQQNAAKYQMDAALYEAEREAARAAIADQNFNPADFTGLEYPDYGDDLSRWQPDEFGSDEAAGERAARKLAPKGKGKKKSDAVTGRMRRTRKPSNQDAFMRALRNRPARPKAKPLKRKRKGGR